MWDERECFARSFINAIACMLGGLGVTIATLSVASGSPALFASFLRFLGGLGAVVLVYAIVVGGPAIVVREVVRWMGRRLRRPEA
ncbi:hypothetical protein [Tautonia plasticadhaerens]|uniref:Uncharacterized protein n=1 Tax=Tautonia plasticadhaerens TaxID=2527974 RepID=A0A518GZY0_9BACT|nr:hypothetical protein [Tautonia plasticadhaerens]QDV34139.1 hypothetical protein ElP_20220 [Tautonia plasticadhaerens]